MSRGSSIITLFAAMIATTQAAKLQLISYADRIVLAGSAVKNEVRLSNRSDAAIETDLYLRLFQRSSATLMPLGETRLWKRITVLPRQTVLEEVAAEIPRVRAATTFELRCSDSRGEAIGTVVISAYPANVLSELDALAGPSLLGLYDPQRYFSPALTKAGVDLVNLEQVAFEEFRGRLLVVFPGESEAVRKRAAQLVRRGVRALMIESSPRTIARDAESSLVTHEHDGARWAHLPMRNVADFKTDAAAQLRLISAIRLLMKTNLCENELKP